MKTNVCFKRISHGNNKGDIIAIMANYSNDLEALPATYILFDESITPRNKQFFKEAKNATVKEYSATKIKLERDFKLDLEIVNRIKY